MRNGIALDNSNDSKGMLATVARAMGLQLLLSDKSSDLFLMIGAMTVTIIVSGKKPCINRLLYNNVIRTYM